MIRISVVYALPQRQDQCALEVTPGTTLRQAVMQSGLLQEHPQSEPLRLGIYGRPCAPEALASEGDRIEIYRELLTDPKEARRRRARHQR